MATETYTYISTLICDDCRKEDNGKDIAVGIYAGSIATSQVPFQMPIFAFRFEIVPHRQRYEQVIATINDPQGKEVVRVGGIIEFARTNVPVSFSFRIAPLPFQSEGKYTVCLAMDDELRELYEFNVELTTRRIANKKEEASTFQS